ncbi:hypothetical protein CEXT_442561 [Caerostris extrusa]|uniref:Uncharacterized protein n=1 Tax=Caerostris extrusa TaxID=172846 RepID=A0AAV4PCI3_CAEEX|nr:hypothetical protein CEXT_442561 [Caerostris extrusa]
MQHSLSNSKYHQLVDVPGRCLLQIGARSPGHTADEKSQQQVHPLLTTAAAIEPIFGSGQRREGASIAIVEGPIDTVISPAHSMAMGHLKKLVYQTPFSPELLDLVVRLHTAFTFRPKGCWIVGRDDSTMGFHLWEFNSKPDKKMAYLHQDEPDKLPTTLTNSHKLYHLYFNGRRGVSGGRRYCGDYPISSTIAVGRSITCSGGQLLESSSLHPRTPCPLLILNLHFLFRLREANDAGGAEGVGVGMEKYLLPLAPESDCEK